MRDAEAAHPHRGRRAAGGRPHARICIVQEERGGGDRPADTEADARSGTPDGVSALGISRQETGVQAGQAGEPIWLVDPNDGARDYLAGRHAARSRSGRARGRPMLSVVFAFAYPDDAGDLFA